MTRSRFKLSNARTRQEEIVLLNRALRQIRHAKATMLPALVEVISGHDVELLTADLDRVEKACDEIQDAHLACYRKPDTYFKKRSLAKKRQANFH